MPDVDAVQYDDCGGVDVERVQGQDAGVGARRIMGYTMRTENCRYTEWVDQDSGDAVAEELYDHQNDPQENINVVGRPENRELVGKLREQLGAGWQSALPPDS